MANPDTIESEIGQHIDAFAVAMCKRAMDGKTVHGIFNGVVLEATDKTTPASLVTAYRRDMDAQAEAYRRSPAGVAAAQQNEREVIAAQARIDAAVSLLESLAFSDLDKVLAWLEDFQEPSDRSGVNVPKSQILATFAANGFEPAVNCGDAFDGEDRENVARYIIGQALDTLRWVSIHPVVARFGREWRNKFNA
jgi:hypothetical protein